jgi:hypothetical protein
MTRFAAVAIGLALAVFLARTAHMQTPAPAAPPASTSIVVASPTYVSIPMEITVNRPAAEPPPPPRGGGAGAPAGAPASGGRAN